MKISYTLLIKSGPFSSQGSLTAFHFCQAALQLGHHIEQIFFYHDGVYHANKNIITPQDEFDVAAAWRELALERQIPLGICIASALRRGMLNEQEAERYDKSAVIAKPYEIVGLGQFIKASETADRVLTFGGVS